jgi:hypothetical protein
LAESVMNESMECVIWLHRQGVEREICQNGNVVSLLAKFLHLIDCIIIRMLLGVLKADTYAASSSGSDLHANPQSGCAFRAYAYR